MQIEEILDELNVDYLSSGHHHCRTGWLQLKVCPWCESNNYHLGFNLSGKYFVCWRCSSHSLWETLERLGLARHRLKETIASLDALKINKPVHGPGKLKEPKGRGPLQGVHKMYLRERGFDCSRLQQLWQIEGIGMHARLAWRIYIPILYRGNRVSWTTRAIGDRVTQRYVSASATEESVPHKSICYGLDFCRGSVVICEGPTDVWAIGPGAVAMFGTAFTSAQVKLLIEIPNRFVCFDSAAEAQVKARTLAAQLACFPGHTENLMLDSKDPGEASARELRLVRKTAKI